MEIKGDIYTVLKRCYMGSCPVTTLKTIGYSKYKLIMDLCVVTGYISYGFKTVKDLRRLKS
jgi:hypothetical protein